MLGRYSTDNRNESCWKLKKTGLDGGGRRRGESLIRGFLFYVIGRRIRLLKDLGGENEGQKGGVAREGDQYYVQGIARGGEEGRIGEDCLGGRVWRNLIGEREHEFFL